MRLYAGVVPVDGREWIALQHRDDRPDIANPGMITTFGGLAEHGEDAMAAVIREVAEELTLRLAPSDLTALMEHKQGVGTPSVRCVIFRIHVADVRQLRTTEGAGVITGTPESMLGDTRLTDTCRRAVTAVSAVIRQGGKLS